MSKEIITAFKVGERLDKTLASLYPEYSRSALEKLIESGSISVNDLPRQTRYKLKPGDVIHADFSYFQLPTSEIQLPIIYEDDNVVVINKPVGVLAHSKGAFNKEGTVASWLQTRINPGSGFILENNRAGIVHRLDRGTSGVMIMAKNKETQDHLQGQFSKRNVKKTYIAVVSGELPENEGLIDVPIERNPKKPATFRAGANGKPAQTEFSVLKIYDKRHMTNDGKTYSLVELRPVTGRTHQIRVHLNYLGNPIIGDDFYDGQKYERLLLHAKSLEITLPGGERKVFEAPIPEEFGEFGA